MCELNSDWSKALAFDSVKFFLLVFSFSRFLAGKEIGPVILVIFGQWQSEVHTVYVGEDDE